MKKFLLSMGLLFSLVIVGKSQTVLNEVYTDPGAGKSEFFELYNSSVDPSFVNVNCWTVVTYYETGSGQNVKKGFYVLDMPNDSVGPKSFFTGAADSTFDVQSQTGVLPDFNWNNPVFRSGSTGGYLKKYELNAAGTAYTEVAAPPALNDFFVTVNVTAKYIILVFVDGALRNGFLGGSNSATLAAGIQNLPDLTITPNGPCSGPFTVDFSTLGAMESVIAAGGSDNGYARSSDGKCGAWVKTSSSVNHTPGVTNGSAAGLAGSLTTAESISCGTSPRFILFDVTAVTGSVTELADFPLEFQVYADADNSHTLTGGDIFIKSKPINSVAASSDTIQIKPPYQNSSFIVVYKTKRGCFDKVISLVSTCAILPVNFKNFTAARNQTAVLLKWETATEENSAGFALERNVRGNWEEIAYVPSQALNGNSSSVLSYQYTDLNDAKGISQYRVRQVDLNGKVSYSAIRAIRGQGQLGNTVVFPNPTNNGKVSVVFEDASTVRDVTLVDMSGRVIKQWRNAINNIQIDNLTPGMYSLRIMVPETGEQSVEKIVVTKQ
ncbi:MAG TPA: T9SS type A sorting domain-containing protein [Chitinophagaceae bacterium]